MPPGPRPTPRFGAQEFTATLRTNIREGRPQERSLRPMDSRFGLELNICRLAELNARREDLEPMDLALAESIGNWLLVWLMGQVKDDQSAAEWDRIRVHTLTRGVTAVNNRQRRAVFDAVRPGAPEAAAMKDQLKTTRRPPTRAGST
ncbi:MAG: hypothetical protein AAF631_05360 [Pseudomonadota bacterium]